VLILKGESLHPATLTELKASTGALLAVWWVDHPFMNAETGRRWRHVPDCLPLFDRCFVFDRSYEAVLHEAGARHIGFLPCTVDPESFAPRKLEAMDWAAYGANVSFLGTYYKSRARVISALAGEPGLRVWGPGWKRFFAERTNGIAQQFSGEAEFPFETCKIYNTSLVNLNAHHPQTQEAGLNMRAFEILAAGAFELTDYVPGMEALLEPGRDAAVYRSPEEAAELARYYLKTPDSRRRLAESGHRRVLAEHTYRHRMQTVLATL
jgi:spore maturation protein CgeB